MRDGGVRMKDKIIQYVQEKSRIDKQERLLLSVSTKNVTEALSLERTRVSKVLNTAVKQKEILKKNFRKMKSKI